MLRAILLSLLAGSTLACPREWQVRASLSVASPTGPRCIEQAIRIAEDSGARVEPRLATDTIARLFDLELLRGEGRWFVAQREGPNSALNLEITYQHWGVPPEGERREYRRILQAVVVGLPTSCGVAMPSDVIITESYI